MSPLTVVELVYNSANCKKESDAKDSLAYKCKRILPGRLQLIIAMWSPATICKSLQHSWWPYITVFFDFSFNGLYHLTGSLINQLQKISDIFPFHVCMSHNFTSLPTPNHHWIALYTDKETGTSRVYRSVSLQMWQTYMTNCLQSLCSGHNPPPPSCVSSLWGHWQARGSGEGRKALKGST